MAGLVRAVNKLLSEQNMTLLMIKIVVNNTMMSQWKNKPKLPSKSTNDSALLPDIKSSLVTSRDRLELVETETLHSLDLNNNRFAIDPLVVTLPQKMVGWTTNVEEKVKLYHYKNCLELQLVNKNMSDIMQHHNKS